jgi:thiol:disulfide interchange protein DsbG
MRFRHNHCERSQLKPFIFSACLSALMVLTLGACSKQEPSAAPASTATTPIASNSYDAVAATAKGFAVGALMSAQTVYVLFDPQCPHCGHLWQASIPLHNKVKFVWVPIAFNTGKSLSQAVALLSAVNPLEAMNAHEQSLLAGTGGIDASSSLPPDLEQAVKNNTQLLTNLGVDSVPFLVAKNRKTEAVVSNTGALDTGPLTQLLGID